MKSISLPPTIVKSDRKLNLLEYQNIDLLMSTMLSMSKCYRFKLSYSKYFKVSSNYVDVMTCAVNSEKSLNIFLVFPFLILNK